MKIVPYLAKSIPPLITVGVFALYAGIVYVFGFTEPIGLAIHFIRTTVVLAVIMIYLPSLRFMFDQEPLKNRDFLLVGIILTEISNVCFSIWNEAHRIWNVDNNIFTSPISAFFSLLLIVGGVSLLLASDVEDTNRWVLALLGAVIFGATFAFVAPIFR